MCCRTRGPPYTHTHTQPPTLAHGHAPGGVCGVAQLDRIAEKDKKLTGPDQIERLTKPAAKYLNINPFEVRPPAPCGAREEGRSRGWSARLAGAALWDVCLSASLPLCLSCPALGFRPSALPGVRGARAPQVLQVDPDITEDELKKRKRKVGTARRRPPTACMCTCASVELCSGPSVSPR